jgi:hypothetical protein
LRAGEGWIEEDEEEEVVAEEEDRMWRGKWMMKKRTRKHRDQLRRTSCGSA